MPASLVPVKQWRPLLSGVMRIAPMHEADDDRIEAQALLRQPVFMPQRCLAVGHLLQHAMIHKVLQPLGQHAPRNAQPILKLIKSPHTEKCLSQDEQRPAIAHHSHRARQRAILPVKFLPLHISLLSLTPSYFKTYLKLNREARMPDRNATCAIIGAGDFIGSAIARKFAAEGYTVFAGRRTAEKLEKLKTEIEATGGKCVARGLDARREEDITGFLQEADAHAPLEVVISNPGANVNFPILDTTERVFFKVWEIACKAGFLTGREAARLMLARGKGSIFFTGATASLRGGAGYAAFASAKGGLRMMAQAMARELGPQNIHIAHLIIDAGVDTDFVRDRIKSARGEEAVATLPPDTLMDPASIADAYWYLHQQKRDAWTFEMDLRPYKETW